MQQIYTQCLLRDVNGGQTVSWIPKACALTGSWVILKEQRGSDEPELWQVLEAYKNTELPADQLLDLQKQSKNTRKASDI